MTVKPASIEIVVNGEPRRAPEGATLLAVLEFLGVDPARVAVEMDRDIVRKVDWPETLVGGGAQLEIVQFVGGG